MRGEERAMHGGDGILLAGMGAGGEPSRAGADEAAQAGEFGRIGRQGGAGELEVARRGHAVGAEAAQAGGISLGAGLHPVEHPHDLAREAGRAEPAAQAALG